MTTRLITIGSCLSFVVACHYHRLSSVECLSSTRHNRIDKLVKTYLYQVEPELSESMVSLLRFKPDQGQAQEIIENQFSNQNLGKTALPQATAVGLKNIVEQNQDIDLILYDCYCDLLFKLLIPKTGQGTVFFNTASCYNWQEWLTLEKERLEIDNILIFYNQFIEFFQKINTKIKIISINFPFLNHHNQVIVNRTAQLNDAFINHPNLKANSYFIPAISIPGEYRLNPNHFKYHNCRNLYDDYALIVKLIMENQWTPQAWYDFLHQKGDHLLDEIRLFDNSFPGYRTPVYSFNKG